MKVIVLMLPSSYLWFAQWSFPVGFSCTFCPRTYGSSGLSQAKHDEWDVSSFIHVNYGTIFRGFERRVQIRAQAPSEGLAVVTLSTKSPAVPHVLTSVAPSTSITSWSEHRRGVLHLTDVRLHRRRYELVPQLHFDKFFRQAGDRDHCDSTCGRGCETSWD